MCITSQPVLGNIKPLQRLEGVQTAQRHVLREEESGLFLPAYVAEHVSAADHARELRFCTRTNWVAGNCSGNSHLAPNASFESAKRWLSVHFGDPGIEEL